MILTDILEFLQQGEINSITFGALDFSFVRFLHGKLLSNVQK